MDLEISRERLLSAVSKLQGLLERNASAPVLQHILFEASNSKLRLSATDLENAIRITLPLESLLKQTGSFTLDGRRFASILTNLSGDAVSISASDADTDRIEVGAGRFKSKLMGLDPRSFPALKSERTEDETRAVIKIAAAKLRDLISKSVFCVSKDEARYNLSGILLEMAETGGLRCVGTDGHRLGLVERGMDNERVGIFKPVILPRRGVTELAKMLASLDGNAEVTLTITRDIAIVAFDDTEMTMRLVEGEFPDYRGVIPKEPKHRASVSHKDLSGAIKRVAVFSNERYHGVKFTFEADTLRLSSTTPETGEASEDIDLKGFDGEAFGVGFNVTYLQQALATMPEDADVTFGVSDEVSPGLLTTAADSQFTYVVMPLRI